MDRVTVACLFFVFFVLQSCKVRSQRTFDPNPLVPPPGFGQAFGRVLSPAELRRLMEGNNRVANPVVTPQPVRGSAQSRAPAPAPPGITPVRTRPRPQPRGRRPISAGDVNSIVNEAMRTVEEEDRAMRRRLDNGVDRYAPDFTNPDPLLFSESPEKADHFSRPSRIINWIARILKEQYPGTTLPEVLSHPTIHRFPVSCPFKLRLPFCDAYSKYRTVDGQCNNIDNPLWGSAFVPFKRLLPPQYETVGRRDDSPRRAGDRGLELPNARIISTRFHEPSLRTSDDSVFSMVFTLFGQFLSHDITDRAPTKGWNDAVLKCCNQNIFTPQGVCSNIAVPQRDFFRQFNRDCIEFARSLEVTDLTCSLGVREQLNQASAFIDGGAVYGATKNKSDSLRRFQGGLLMMSVPQQLPIMPHPNTRATIQGFAFYAAGDNRVNEFIGLIGMETLWAREHNRIAEALSKIQPGWSDEILFQETRRIVIAFIQHITYAEYLPALLGPSIMTKYGLQAFKSGRFTHYDRRIDAGLANAFASVAMRFGHSMLRTTFPLLNSEFRDNGYADVELKDSFFRPQTFLLHEDPLMRGMAANASKLCDRVMSDNVINNLYQTETGNGFDLAAANIQRGREHGLAEYASWRRYFGLSVPTGFDRFSFPDHDADTIRLLQRVYRSAADVDLFTGGLSEKPEDFGAVGPLFANIIANQFKEIRDGDRFWYETNEAPQAFTDRQLAEIRKVTMARLLCNTYNFDRIQRRVFFSPDAFSNGFTSCNRIDEVDLNAWRDV